VFSINPKSCAPRSEENTLDILKLAGGAGQIFNVLDTILVTLRELIELFGLKT
jgi:hypothetical protein